MRGFSEDPHEKEVATEEHTWNKQSTQRAASCQDKVVLIIRFRRNLSLNEFNDS